MTMATSRSALVYADFLLPHLTSATHVVDVGCGSGELTLDLAPSVGSVTGIDAEPPAVQRAARRAHALGIENADFVVGDAYALDVGGDEVDAVLAHSVLEALNHPAEALSEMRRILKPGGVLAVASVEYAGLILAGPHEPLTRRFYDIREQLWQSEGADPHRGRQLRRLLIESGYVDVRATTRCIDYGTPEAVEEFGRGRAADCTDEWYVSSSLRQGLATRDDLSAMRRAWLDWSLSPASYASFAWCRALGWKPAVQV